MEIDDLLVKALPEIARRIENELVLSAPVDTGRLKSSIKVRIKTKNKKIEVTEDHPIWINQVWKKAGKLKKGDKIKRLW